MKYLDAINKLDENKVWDREWLKTWLAQGVEPATGWTNQASDNSNHRKTVLKLSEFVFGPASEKELVGVDKRLVAVNRRALQLSEQDYCIYDGIRTIKEQQTHVRNGTSRTMQSRHLDGLATDNVPWINGKPTWDWDGCFKIALAMDQAATELGYADLITWGGDWSRRLSDYGGDKWQAYRVAVDHYKQIHPGPDFIDGPHFEIAGPRQL